MGEKSIRTAAQRAGLAPGGKHWEPLGNGLSVGIYKGVKSDTWLARVKDPTGRQRWRFETLGSVEPSADGLDYAGAIAAATAWRGRITVEAEAKAAGVATVGQAGAEWLAATTSRDGSVNAAVTMKNRKAEANQIVAFLGANTPLGQVSIRDCEAFRDRPMKNGRPRSKSTGDRELATLKAMLTAGADRLEHDVPRQWTKARKHGTRRTELERLDEAGGDGFGRVLSVDQVRHLIEVARDAVSPQYSDWIAAMFLCMARPEALRQTDVRDWNSERQTLRYRRGKNASKRGAIEVEVFDETAWLLDRLAAGKAPTDPLLPAENGGRWLTGHDRMRLPKALKAAGIGLEGLTAYSLRHSALTWALVDQNISPALVARTADTSIELLLKHYLRGRHDLGAGPGLLRRAKLHRTVA